MIRSTLPVEFMSLGITGEVWKKSPNEYASACPKCGGKDRFVMWIKSETTGGPFAKCVRHCDFQWWPEMDNDWRPTAEEIAERMRASELRLQQEIKIAQDTLQELREAQLWMDYHENLTKPTRQLWMSRGLTDWWQDWWKLGATNTTLTIPIWGNGWQVNNIKHRVLEPNGTGKYYQEKKGVPAASFICDPDRTFGPLFVCEGEIKAMVTFATIDATTIQVAGIPIATPSQDMVDLFAEYDPVYLCPDPDTFAQNGKNETQVERLISLFGNHQVRVVQLPDKIDDLINMGAIDKDLLRELLRSARKVR